MKRIATIAVAIGAIAAPARSDTPPPEPSPYLTIYPDLDADQRAAAEHARADASERAGDRTNAARHLAMECAIRAAAAFDTAIEIAPCPRARALARDLGLVDADVFLQVAEGNLAAWSLDVMRAVQLLQGALLAGASLDAASPDGAPLRWGQFTLGAILVEGGYYDQAIGALTQSRADSEAAGDRFMIAWNDTWLCRAYDVVGDLARANTHCTLAQAFVDADHELNVDMNLAWIRGDLASAHGRYEEALAAYRHGYELSLLPGGKVIQPTLRLAIASSLIPLGRFDEARGWLDDLVRDQDAGKMPATYRHQIEAQVGWNRLAINRPADAVAPFEIAVGSPMHSVAITSGNGLALARALSGDRTGAIAALEASVARIEADRANVDGAAGRATFMAMHATVYRELALLRWDEDGDAGAARILEVAEAGRARALLDALTAAQVAGAAAHPASAAEVQARLAPDQLLIEYVVTSRRALALAVTRDAVHAVELPGAGAAATLGERVRFFRQLVAESAGEAAITPAAKRLHHDLLAPVLAFAPAAARTLIVSPDGPIHDLPFDALRGDDGFVVARWDVAVVPSASAITARAASPDAHGALIVATPEGAGGLAALPRARDEAAAVAARIAEPVSLIGDDASEAALDAAGPGRFAVLHLASHAVVDDALPLRSALVLAPGDAAHDGRWRAEEIYKLTLGADLVVLSACRTADGAQASGEGVLSLARAFLHAGAAATIATGWDVDDASGPAFAAALYRRLGDGAPLGAATAGAKRALRDGGAPPRAWAAYVLAGSPGATVRGVTRAPPARSPRTFGASLVLLGIGGAIAIGAAVRRVKWAGVLAGGCALGAVIAVAVPPATRPIAAAPAPVVIAQRGAATWTAPAAGARYYDADGLPLPSAEGAAWVSVAGAPISKMP